MAEAFRVVKKKNTQVYRGEDPIKSHEKSQ